MCSIVQIFLQKCFELKKNAYLCHTIPTIVRLTHLSNYSKLSYRNVCAAKARRADKTTGRGATPAKYGGNGSPEGATEWSVTPSGLC